jgi:ubiquinone/menaquinone biosynthesis C-methylase UbiE
VSRRELIASYDALFGSEASLRDTDAFYRWALGRLSPKPGSRLLDVACGEGHLMKFAHQNGIEAFGIDFSLGATLRARGSMASSVVAVADGEALPFPDESFDYVMNLGSLEHFLHPLRGVEEMRRVLRHEGQAAFLLPNSYYLADIIWHVWRTGYGASHRQLVERFATFREWADLLEQGGLEVRKAKRYNFCFPRSRNDWLWYTRRPQRLLNLLLAPFVPFNLSYSFLYICAKKPDSVSARSTVR